MSESERGGVRLSSWSSRLSLSIYTTLKSSTMTYVLTSPGPNL